MSETVDLDGLSTAEVDQRIASGRVNDVPDAPVRTLGQIIRANMLTPVNAIMTTLLVLILIAESPGDALFSGVIVSNTVIGIAQELRARRTLHKLEILSAPKARAVRDGTTIEIGVSQVVQDDLLALSPGDQVVVDGQIVHATGLEADESLLTGESEAVDKGIGDEVLSGSFVASGSGYYRATHIGGESYASKLAEEARIFKLADSELRRGVNTILRWLTFIIPPAAALLFLRLLNSLDRWQDALRDTVAAAVAMVPDGLVLLTSMAFIVGVIALARRQALAKELSSVELLARVDTLCLDKTGTITTGEISLSGIEPLRSHDEDFAQQALGAMAASDPSPNATLLALVEAFPPHAGWDVTATTPFSSARKWAGAHFGDHGSFYLGAPDILLDEHDVHERAIVAEHAEQGRRVLLLTRFEGPYDGEQLPEQRSPVAMVLLEDTVREDAPEILRFFRGQGVDIKVISGDHPQTVAAVARRAGVPNAEAGYDARELPEENESMADVLDKTAVFGRVTPHQKRAMVGALQSRGHIVAMTGDGVNDVLALKDADMGIAMGAGSSSARAVAQLVLLDNKFSTLPRVLAEGRRVINNIERVANLFITKATYAVVLTLLIGITGEPFPFLPRQLTLIGTFSIGIPGFFLALSPNTNLVRPGFLDRVLRFSIPAGVIAGTAAFIVYMLVPRGEGTELTEARTAATITLLVLGLVILVLISRPLAVWKIGLAVAMALSYVVIMAWPYQREYFELDVPPDSAFVKIAIVSAIASAALIAVPRFLPWLNDQPQEEPTNARDTSA
jgi:cation-transporting ATPase E